MTYTIQQRIDIYMYLYMSGLYEKDICKPFFMCEELDLIGRYDMSLLPELNSKRPKRILFDGSWWPLWKYEKRFSAIEQAIIEAEGKLK
jgi:hypothetical protein